MRTIPAQNPPSISTVAAGEWRLPNAASIRAAAVRATSRETRRHSWPFVVAIALRAMPGPTRILAYAWATGYAFLGRRQAIMALMLIWLCNMFTQAVGLPPGGAAFFRHAAVFAAAFSVFVLHASAPPRSRTPVLLVWTATMSMLLLLHSMLFSKMPDISVLKAISYALTIQTFLVAWSRLSLSERALAENQVLGLLYAILVCSVPLVVLPAGYIRTRSGFQGVMEHPQLFGQLCGIVAVWLSATWLTDRHMRLSLKILLVTSLAGIYLSRSRMALVLYLTGVAVAIVAGPLSAAVSRSRLAPRLLKGRLTLAMGGALVLVIVGGSLFYEVYEVFVRKGGKSIAITEAAWEARGFLVERMQLNIREQPMTGIGFGVPSSPEMMYAIIRDPIFGLPVMATVEKGVLPVAMVEEMGWPLALLYAPWFIALLVSAVRAGPRYAGVCAAALTLNATEAVFFSPGGGGMMVQLLVAMAATAVPPGKNQALLSRAAIAS